MPHRNGQNAVAESRPLSKIMLNGLKRLHSKRPIITKATLLAWFEEKFPQSTANLEEGEVSALLSAIHVIASYPHDFKKVTKAFGAIANILPPHRRWMAYYSLYHTKHWEESRDDIWIFAGLSEEEKTVSFRQ